MTNTDIAARNKDLIARCLDEFTSGNIEALRELLHPDFREHSPGNPSGRDAFIEFIATSPVAAAQFEIKRVIADDEYAIVHYRMIAPGDSRGLAVVDIWRLEDGLIIEHWDVVQPMPDAELIPHGMF